jgi:outer membrane lipoprotein LolB
MNFRWCLPILAAFTVGCDSLPAVVEPQAVDEPQLAFESRREALAALSGFELAGRMALKSHGEGWSATVSWVETGELWRMRLSGPLGQGALQLSGDGAGVALTTADGKVHLAATAEALLARTTGMKLPVSGLRHWLKGDIDPDREVEAMVLGEGGLLESLRQGGWTITYDSYLDADGLPMPRRLEITNATANQSEDESVSGRLAIHRWQLDRPAGS